MKKILFLSIILICGFSVFLSQTLSKIYNSKQSQKMDSLIISNTNLKKQVDSLNGEIFVKEIQRQRYEYIFDRAKDEMSVDCKNKLEKIYGETE